jgi:hypothetical protein
MNSRKGTPLAYRIIIRRTDSRTPQPGGSIKSFSVGLLALAAVAAASYLLRRRKPVAVVVANRGRYRDVGDFYAAGM